MKLIGHGGKEIVERVISSPPEAREHIQELKQIPVSGHIARECIDIAYGFITRFIEVVRSAVEVYN